MQVNNIIRNCAVLLDDEQFLSELDSSSDLSEQSSTIKNKLLECVNIVNRKIATQYFPIKLKKVSNTNNNKIKLSSLSNEKIIDILHVCENNVKIGFNVENGYIVTESGGKMTITYSILPKTVQYNDSIDYYENKISDYVFAYGVVSEYLYIMGNTVDAQVWENKFVEGVRGVTTRNREIVMPVRSWY